MTNFEQKYTVDGVQKSSIDERDYLIDKLIKNAVLLPDEFIIDTKPIILDQQTSSECVGCSAAQIKHVIEAIQTQDSKMFSPSYIYANRTDSDYHGEGMMPRQALDNLKTFGMCHYEDFQGFYSYADACTKYSAQKADLDKKAYPYRISSYYRLNTIEDVKTAIYTTKIPAFVSYDVYKSMYYPDSKGVVNYDPNDKNVLGGHQMSIFGWNNTGFIVVNSWGEEFGQDGVITIPYEYAFSECWAMVDTITEQALTQV